MVYLLFCPRTAAGISIAESTAPQVTEDMLLGLSASFPDRPEYAHAGDNFFAHIKSSVTGRQPRLIIIRG